MSKLCDECETVAHCMKHGCIPKQQALDKKAENARELGLDYEPVCNKDPQGCWNVRCQLGKKCKNAQAQQEPVAPKCGAIIEVFGKDWRLEYMSLPVGKHKLYTQQYTYISPPAQRKPLTDEDIEQRIGYRLPAYGFDAIRQLIKENT